MNAVIFGQRIRQYRTLHAWEQIDLAQRIHKSVATVSRIENGGLKLNLDVMQALAEAFEVPLFVLVLEEPDNKREHDPALTIEALQLRLQEVELSLQAATSACQTMHPYLDGIHAILAARQGPSPYSGLTYSGPYRFALSYAAC
jgi:Predicted transcription factor, homolog of eukaryotic MBF1